MKKYLTEGIAILILGVAFGVIYNAISPSGMSLFADQNKSVAGFKMMTTEEIKIYILEKKDKVVIVDARSKEEYSLGHIPGAINIPATDFDKYYQIHLDKIKKAEMIIVYCSGGSCGSSEEVASQLIKKGINPSKVAVDQDGLPGWIRGKNPIEYGESTPSK